MEENMIYDVFISASSKDREFTTKLFDALLSEGISVYNWNDVGGNYAEAIVSAICSSRVFVPLITKNSVNSDMCLRELDYAISRAKDRSKIIFPVMLPDADIKKSYSLQYYLATFQIMTTESDSARDAKKIALKIAELIKGQRSENETYEKLYEYTKAGANERASDLLCDLITKKCLVVENLKSKKERKALYTEICQLLEKLEKLYGFEYSPSSKSLAEKKMTAVMDTRKLLSSDDFKNGDLYMISLALRLIYFDREIGWAVIDAKTHGDLSDGIISALPESDYVIKQAPYVLRYESELKTTDISEKNTQGYSREEAKFILETTNYIYSSSQKKPAVKVMPAEKPSVSGDDELLRSVASFMQEGNKLFDLIGEHQAAEEFLRCVILSYERLKAYCDVVGEKEICAECIDRIVELKSKLNSVKNQTSITEKAETGIKTLLGLTIPKSGNYDVFICHKKEDMDIATDMYYFLQNNLKEVFLDKFSLPEMSESQYRKAIMQALDGSSHFVVILSDLEYMESYWVKLEMEIFQSEIDEGRKPNSNFIMVVTNDVYDSIIRSNKSVIPIDYRRCEIMRVEDYKNSLISYFNR